MPDLDIDEVDLAQRVLSLAAPRRLPVLYLGLVLRDDHESLMRRRLVSLAALTRNKEIHVETHCEYTSSWLEAIRAAWQPGDLIISPPEQLVSYRGNGRDSLRRELSSALRAPVHVLPDLHVMTRPDRTTRVMRLVFWLVTLAIIAGFFWLQVQIEQATQGGLRMLLLILTVLLEGSLLILWNALTS